MDDNKLTTSGAIVLAAIVILPLAGLFAILTLALGFGLAAIILLILITAGPIMLLWFAARQKYREIKAKHQQRKNHESQKEL